MVDPREVMWKTTIIMMVIHHVDALCYKNDISVLQR